jgi:hypothetical protein
VQVSAGDVNVNSRSNGTLATPANLAGAVQMKGAATMTPGSNGGRTSVNVNLSNATPGGLHPGQLHRGQCGADEGVVGGSDAYKTLKVDKYVSVGASGANPETIVACGNLAPPSR